MNEIALATTLKSLYGYAIVLTRNPADAADLVQETCLRALNAQDSLKEESNTRGWLFTILRRIWLNQIRHARIVTRTFECSDEQNIENVAVDRSKNPHTLYAANVDIERVRRAVDQLPHSYREVILLPEFADLSYVGVAQRLGCPVGTVMSRLARARARLRRTLSLPSATISQQDQALLPDHSSSLNVCMYRSRTKAQTAEV